MASGLFFGGLASGFQRQEALNNQQNYQQGLLALEQQRLRQQQVQQIGEQIDKMTADLFQHIDDDKVAPRNGGTYDPKAGYLSISRNVDGIADLIAKTRGPQYADMFRAQVATAVAAPPSTTIEAAHARAKEGPLAQEEKRARIDYLKAGIPQKPGQQAGPNPDAPGLPGNDTALGTPATFNQRFAQAPATSTTDVGADVGEQAGQDYLKKNVDPTDADLVQSVANYDTDPNTPSGRVPRGQTKSRREAVIEQAMAYAKAKGEIYNPRAFKVVQDFLGAGKHGDLVRSLNVVTDHMQTIRNLGEALQNGDNQTINSLFNRWATEFGKPQPTNLTLGLKIVGTELVKAMGVAGAGSKEDRQELQNTINTSSSNSQIIGAIEEVAGPLLSGQLNGLRNQYVSGGGPRERFDKTLFPATRQYLDKERPSQKKSSGEWSVEEIK